MTTISENNSAWLRVTFRDSVGAMVAPVGLTYRVNCLTTNTVIRAQTAVTPAGQVSLPLTSTDNRIVNPANAAETRRITVVAIYGPDDQLTHQFDYRIAKIIPAP